MTCNPAVPTNSDNSLKKNKKINSRKKESKRESKKVSQTERMKEKDFEKRNCKKYERDMNRTYFNEETSAIRCEMPISIQITHNNVYTPYRTY